jgi:hypothetical protein
MYIYNKSMEYKCKNCNKEYKSYQSLWNHNKKFHNHNATICQSTFNSNVSPTKSII